MKTKLDAEVFKKRPKLYSQIHNLQYFLKKNKNQGGCGSAHL